MRRVARYHLQAARSIGIWLRPLHRRPPRWCAQADRPTRRSSFHARPFYRIGMIGTVLRSMMAVWQRRVSQAPSAVTVPIGAPAWIWPSRPGNAADQETVRGTVSPTNGLSPSRLGVKSTARMSDGTGSVARGILRHWRRPCGPCLRACHSASSAELPSSRHRSARR